MTRRGLFRWLAGLAEAGIAGRMVPVAPVEFTFAPYVGNHVTVFTGNEWTTTTLNEGAAVQTIQFRSASVRGSESAHDWMNDWIAKYPAMAVQILG